MTQENALLRSQLNIGESSSSYGTVGSINATSISVGTSSESYPSDTDDSESTGDESASFSATSMSTLFSFFALFGMTFWSAPGQILPASGNIFSNSISFTQLSLPSPSPFNRPFIDGSKEELSLVSSHRRLSSSSSSPAYSLTSSDLHSGVAEFLHLPNLEIDSGSDELWHYDLEDRVAHLFPSEKSLKQSVQKGIKISFV